MALDQARQGHLYDLDGQKVLALESGQGDESVTVRGVLRDFPWLDRRQIVSASMLQPLPMRYFHGQVPK